jgi:hypothetical protein
LFALLFANVLPESARLTLAAMETAPPSLYALLREKVDDVSVATIAVGTVGLDSFKAPPELYATLLAKLAPDSVRAALP